MYKVQIINSANRKANYHKPFQDRQKAEAHVLELFKRHENDKDFIDRKFLIIMLMPENEYPA